MPRNSLALFAFLLAPLLFAAPERWAAAIDKFTDADKTQPPAHASVVFIDSSSIARWKSLEKDFPGVPVLNRGFGGSQLEDSVFYADRIVIPYRPRAVVLYAGDNDLNAGKTPEIVHADFKAFIAKVHATLPQTRIVFIAIKPSMARWKIRDKGVRANALIAAECARDARLRFVDVWQPMLDRNGEPRCELFVADQLHLSEAGYALWTPLVAAEVFAPQKP